MEQKTGWWQVGSLSDSFGTYVLVPYETLPPITSLECFRDVRTLKHLQTVMKKDKELVHSMYLDQSPTGCRFKFDETPTFFIDSQGCVAWMQYEEGGAVFATTYDDPVMVAKDLPEFLTRLCIENFLWYHLYLQPVRPLPCFTEEDASAYLKTLRTQE